MEEKGGQLAEELCSGSCVVCGIDAPARMWNRHGANLLAFQNWGDYFVNMVHYLALLLDLFVPWQYILLLGYSYSFMMMKGKRCTRWVGMAKRIHLCLMWVGYQWEGHGVLDEVPTGVSGCTRCVGLDLGLMWEGQGTMPFHFSLAGALQYWARVTSHDSAR